MENYYETLEIKPGASQSEIKRAYFRMVRKYTPEKDPVRFQEIRRAYEYLKQENEDEKDTFSLEMPKEKLGQQMMRQTEESFQKKDYDLTIRTAEEAIRLFGPCSGYVYYLALAQRMEGKTGKSVKNLEILTKRFPDEPRFQKELALSLQERGFGNKALTAFEKAYEMGERDAEFLLMFSLCCEDRGDVQRGNGVLRELIGRESGKHPRKNEVLLDAYSGLLSFSIRTSEKMFRDTVEEMKAFLLESGAALEPYEDMLNEILLSVGAAGFLNMEPDVQKNGSGFLISIDTARQAAQTLAETLGKVFPSLQDQWDKTEQMLTVLYVQTDPDLSETVKMTAALFYAPEEDYLNNEQFYRFIQEDCRLCILEEWPQNKKEFELIRERYPKVYDSLRECIRQMEDTDTEYLRDILLKDYDRLSKFYSGYYYKNYPNRRYSRSYQSWDSDTDGTFRRQGKKIGRNDPCPCGSGKKYKNCCGRK